VFSIARAERRTMSAKDDTSTDIETHVKKFMVDMGTSATALLKKLVM